LEHLSGTNEIQQATIIDELKKNAEDVKMKTMTSNDPSLLDSFDIEPVNELLNSFKLDGQFRLSQKGGTFQAKSGLNSFNNSGGLLVRQKTEFTTNYTT
jgi:hypothetical protein